jgi:hypothetical protein
MKRLVSTAFTLYSGDEHKIVPKNYRLSTVSIQAGQVGSQSPALRTRRKIATI